MSHKLLAIDQGTTSSRAIVYDDKLQPIGCHQLAFEQHFPQSGWVEHDPEDIWQTVLDCARKAMANSESADSIAAIGITNQRETIIGWRRSTGDIIANAIVWQDRRTKDLCERLKSEQVDQAVQAKTGLLLDPYFSATKIQWLIEHVAKPKHIPLDDLCFGTVDSFLIWRLTKGQRFVTDITNAAQLNP